MSRDAALDVCPDFARRSGVAPVVIGLACLLAPAAQSAEPRPWVVVAILNYADLSRETLDVAEEQASKIFSEAGVAVKWWELPVSGSAASEHATAQPAAWLRLLPRSMADRFSGIPGALGCTLDRHAYVYADRVRDVAARAATNFPRALGHIMAHELGHVFLGENSHAAGGIMSPKQGTLEFRRMNMGGLQFSKVEAQRMRRRILAEQTALAARKPQ
ncbi:MAG TPA: hypothetical protein VLH09_01500 [Bryobacteraceae bacterium]|nr:hypothetical protein [Bryobacteraceae bacterium]